ncbi:hypothetical protein T11_15033 [Trichinella zimbabwensis]|uniref:Uncharacterized protein n=1 Tax=Trichinella zimbabwensis TaxID=268475 RepID=A0A0V1I626_9BILA|nr:hypothetical protein T11_15033 [Trichinella zimbabwensis]
MHSLGSQRCKMDVQQFSQNIFRQLIDQYRLQADDRTRKLLKAFENFERQLQESAQRLNEDRKQRNDQLNKLQKKYSKWKLSKLQDQKCENLDSTTAEKKNMDELKCEIEQLKLQLNNVSGNLLDIREFLKNANNKAEQPKPRSPTTKQFESKLQPVSNAVKRQISTDSSTESEEDSFLNLKFTSIRNNTNNSDDNNSRATATSREVSAEKQRENGQIERQLQEESYSPPRVSFAFDRQRGGKNFNSHNSQLVHAETDTDHSPTSDKSQESRIVDEKNNIVKVNNNNNTTTDTEEEESAKSELNSNDSHESTKKPRSGSYEPAMNVKDKKDEDDFLAKLFPDKFGSKLTLSTTNASSTANARLLACYTAIT